MDNLNSSQMLPVGTILDSRYRIEKYLASGGFGNTYVAFDTRFDCQVAVKEFFMRGTNHRSADHTTVVVSNVENREGFDAQLDKFRREAKRIFNMRNDHIVHVVDLFDTNGTSYYVMDLIEGESLKDRVKRRPLTEVEVRKIADQLLDALGAVHAAGFYHLDVKPGNIMMDKKGHCTLIDFGASKQMSAMDRTSMSASGMAYTPGYAPVEQESQRTKSIGPWTDFYAVGATLYNLLTGQTPPEIDPYDTAADSRMFDYPPGVSRQMQHAISQMMNPAPKMRPQDVEEMRALLKGVSSEETIVYPKNNKDNTTQIMSSSGKKKFWISLAAVACLAGILFFALWPSGNSEGDEPLVVSTGRMMTDSAGMALNGDEPRPTLHPNRVWTIDDVPMAHLQHQREYVSDPDGYLTASEKACADSFLYMMEHGQNCESAFIVVGHVPDKDAHRFAINLGKKYGIGTAETHRGVTVVIAVEDRKFSPPPKASKRN